MIGAIIGDIIGSPYEYQNIKKTEFPLFIERSNFTDDSVTTIAIADAILNKVDYGVSLKKWGRKFPRLDYGAHFRGWLFSNYSDPYNSWGNGSAMRVSPVGFAFNTLEKVLAEAKKSAEVTHNHPEGIKGAQVTASAIFLARNGSSKPEIKEYIEKTFQYDLSKSLNEIRPLYEFDVSCQGSVPQAITSFLEGNDFEDTRRIFVARLRRKTHS